MCFSWIFLQVSLVQAEAEDAAERVQPIRVTKRTVETQCEVIVVIVVIAVVS